MKSNSTKSKNRRNNSKIGAIVFYEEKVRGKWGRWRVEAAKAGGKRPTFGNEDDAKLCALKYDRAYQEKKALGHQIKRDGGDPIALSAASDCQRFNEQENEPRLSQVAELNLKNSVDISKAFLRTMIEINQARSNADIQSYSIPWMLQEFSNHARGKILKEKQKVLFAQRIDEFIKYKCGDHGSKRNRGELSKDAKQEWKNHIGKRLRGWTDKIAVGEEDEIGPTIKKISNEIASMKTWGGVMKKKCAQKIKEFGAWLEWEGYTTKNPFRKLTKDFFIRDDKRSRNLHNRSSEKVFEIAIEGDANAGKNTAPLYNLIPYLALTFFATTRPESDVFKTGDRTRQLTASQINFDLNWGDKFNGVDGHYLTLKEFAEDGSRQSKTKNRQGVFFSNGVKWLRYWEINFNGGKAFEKIYLGRRPFDRLKALLGFRYISDGQRHTSATAACMNFDFAGVHEFFAKRYGHTQETQRNYYDNALMTHDAASAYFNITPELILKKNKL